MKTLQQVVRIAMLRAKQLYGDGVDPLRVSKMIAEAVEKWQAKAGSLQIPSVTF